MRHILNNRGMSGKLSITLPDTNTLLSIGDSDINISYCSVFFYSIRKDTFEGPMTIGDKAMVINEKENKKISLISISKDNVCQVVSVGYGDDKYVEVCNFVSCIRYTWKDTTDFTETCYVDICMNNVLSISGEDWEKTTIGYHRNDDDKYVFDFAAFTDSDNTVCITEKDFNGNEAECEHMFSKYTVRLEPFSVSFAAKKSDGTSHGEITVTISDTRPDFSEMLKKVE